MLQASEKTLSILLFITCCLAGCQSTHTYPSTFSSFASPQSSPIVDSAAIHKRDAAAQPSSDPFLDHKELALDKVLDVVLSRNPSLAQAAAAWEAAQARYPQVTSLDDPMFGLTLGPATYGSSSVNPAYRLELSQKLLFPGKLGLRGAAAQAEANAMSSDLDDAKLMLTESARQSYFDYYLVERLREANEQNLKLLRDAQQNAIDRYRNNLAPQQDVLQAEVELGRIEERKITLDRMRDVAIARLNSLMHRQPDLSLPVPPKKLSPPQELASIAILRQQALDRRPDLQALRHKLNADEANLGLAEREYYPDIEPFAMYDRFMGNDSQTRDLAWMVGFKMNLPVQVSRRDGAVHEMQAKLALRHAELDRLSDQISQQVQEAYAQVTESQRIVKLYETKILPAAENNVKEALTAYTNSSIPFLSLIEAQRSLIGNKDRYYENQAELYRRQAILERVTGNSSMPTSSKAASPER